MKRYNAIPLIDEKFKLGESPFWDERTRVLSFVDITAGRFHRIMPDQSFLSFDCGQPLGAAVPAKKPGTYVFAATDGLYMFENNSIKKAVDLKNCYKPWQRSNDAKADPAGRLFFGSSSMDESCGNNGNLFCLDKSVRVLQPNTKISNGMAWDKSHKRFFFSDSLEHAVFVYAYNEGSGDISERRVLFNVENGIPDGMCIDSDDNLWVAVWGGRRIEHRSSSDGALLEVIDVPAEHVSSCCFSGENTLFITSSGDGLSGKDDGKVFTCRVDAHPGDIHYCNSILD